MLFSGTSWGQNCLTANKYDIVHDAIGGIRRKPVSLCWQGKTFTLTVAGKKATHEVVCPSCGHEMSNGLGKRDVEEVYLSADRRVTFDLRHDTDSTDVTVYESGGNTYHFKAVKIPVLYKTLGL